MIKEICHFFFQYHVHLLNTNIVLYFLGFKTLLIFSLHFQSETCLLQAKKTFDSYLKEEAMINILIQQCWKLHLLKCQIRNNGTLKAFASDQ